MASRRAWQEWPADEDDSTVSAVEFGYTRALQRAAFDFGAVTALREAIDKIVGDDTYDRDLDQWVVDLMVDVLGEWEASGE